MSDFFRAAVKCDVSAARSAPMYIDQTGVMEELYKHERLVEQTLRTKQLLDELDREEKQKASAAAAHSSSISKSEMGDLLGPGTTVSTGGYKEPPTVQAALEKLPQERNPGSKALEKQSSNRLSIYRGQLDEQAAKLRAAERAEQNKEKEEEAQRRRDAERHFNALLTTRQLARHEAEAEAKKAHAASNEGGRIHSIDVLQRRIAADILEEIAIGTQIVQVQLEQDARGVEDAWRLEQLKTVQFKYHNPTKHVPAPW